MLSFETTDHIKKIVISEPRFNDSVYKEFYYPSKNRFNTGQSLGSPYIFWDEQQIERVKARLDQVN